MSPGASSKRSKSSDQSCRASSTVFHSSRNSDCTGRHLRRRQGCSGHQTGGQEVPSANNLSQSQSHNHRQHHAQNQPSAPPMYLVLSDQCSAITLDGFRELDDDCSDQYRNWGPPPRYQEAIAESRISGCRPVSARNGTVRRLQQQHNSCLHDPPGYGVACPAGESPIPPDNPTPPNADQDDNDNSHSVSPSSQAISTQTTELAGSQEKRKTSSKIMKGLERAAFFVIQLLD